jgi:hypothetical protein
MKSQIYAGLPAIPRFGPMVINALGTYFKKILVNHLNFAAIFSGKAAF